MIHQFSNSIFLLLLFLILFSNIPLTCFVNGLLSPSNNVKKGYIIFTEDAIVLKERTNKGSNFLCIWTQHALLDDLLSEVNFPPWPLIL